MSDCLPSARPSHSQLVEKLEPVSAQWDRLGIFLGFKQNDLDEIRRDKQDTNLSLIAMCNKWLERNPSGSWKDIVTALQKIKRLDLADELQKKYIKEEVTSALGNFMPPSEVHTGSVQACTNNDNFPVPKNVTKEVARLESKFSALLARIQFHLKQKVDQDLLSLDELGRFVSRHYCIPYQPVNATMGIDPIDKLFGNLKPDISPFESALLYSIDSAYLRGTMKNEIDAYDNSIDEFENSTVVTDFKNALERHHQSHPGMPLVLKLGKRWGNRTLKNLHHLIRYMFKGNATLLRLISIHYSVLTIMYAVPISLLLSLITMASRKVIGLSLAGVLSIQVGTLLLNISKHDSDLSESILQVAQYSHVDDLKFLLNIGGNVNSRDENNQTPLIFAAFRGEWLALKVLLQYKADPNISRYQDNVTPLYIVSQNGQHGCADLLLRFGAKPNIQANDGHTALHQASRFGYHECVDLLLRNNVNPNIQNQYVNTALHEHVIEIHHQCVSLLLQHKGDPNVLNENGISPLMVASGIGHLKCVKLLLQNNAEPNIRSQHGITALMVATVKGYYGIIELLLKSNADPNIFVQGEGALDIACLSGSASIVSLLIDHDAVIERREGKSLLIAPIQKSDYDTVKILIEAGIDVNVQDEYDGPLLLASASGNKAMVQLLLGAGADIYMQNSLGLTAYAHMNQVNYQIRFLQ